MHILDNAFTGTQVCTLYGSTYKKYSRHTTLHSTANLIIALRYDYIIYYMYMTRAYLVYIRQDIYRPEGHVGHAWPCLSIVWDHCMACIEY